jgi:hypothetical protein
VNEWVAEKGLHETILCSPHVDCSAGLTCVSHVASYSYLVNI